MAQLDYLTLPEVAIHYRTTVAVVRYWRHTGFGPRGVKIGARVLYQRAEIERFDRQLAEDADAASAGRPTKPERGRHRAAASA